MTITDEMLADLETKAKAVEQADLPTIKALCDFENAASAAVVLALVERIRELEQERQEDQGVIAVWRRRAQQVGES
ncbi:hypothetical protein [Myxococcus landrumensis]|uniref:Uncharacterized protein n=1 Tax=Myxococcus landrumensis TaxID=2813577 RepID=A0ABX7N8T9_9BACT|nr:hypothetical protein [Myxococcus landrumus]QSQ14065.1 hypothetical protein JY572_38085 [Myxococcus landrumus]